MKMFVFIDWIDVCFLDDLMLYRLSRKIRTRVEILDHEHGPTGYRWLTTSVPLLLSVSLVLLETFCFTGRFHLCLSRT